MKFLYAIIAVLIFVAGQESIKYQYDPKVLEDNALGLVESAFRHGCIRAHIENKAFSALKFMMCGVAAKKERQDVEQIFRNKIWSK